MAGEPADAVGPCVAMRNSDVPEKLGLSRGWTRYTLSKQNLNKKRLESNFAGLTPTHVHSCKPVAGLTRPVVRSMHTIEIANDGNTKTPLPPAVVRHHLITLLLASALSIWKQKRQKWEFL